MLHVIRAVVQRETYVEVIVHNFFLLGWIFRRPSDYACTVRVSVVWVCSDCSFLAAFCPYVIRVMQWCIAKNWGGYTQTGVAKGLKVPCLFMITEVSTRCQKTPEVGIRRIPAYTTQYTTGVMCLGRITLQITKMIDVNDYSFYPRDAVLARLLAVALCLSVCPSQVVLSKWHDGSSWFWRGGFVQVSTEIRVLPCGTFIVNYGLIKFRHGISIVETCYHFSSRKVDADSVINWTVVGQLSWHHLPAPTLDRLSQWSRRSISDSWYLLYNRFSCWKGTLRCSALCGILVMLFLGETDVKNLWNLSFSLR